MAPVGVALKAMVPAPGKAAPRTRLVARVVRPIGTLVELEGVFGRAKRQREAFETVLEAGGGQSLAALAEKGFSRAVVRGLEAKGLIRVAGEPLVRDPFGDVEVSEAGGLTPTAAQRGVLERLRRVAGRGGGAFVLHGVTSSGKTLVYIELIREVLARGRGALVLVPEIALTPQTVSRFRQAFGNQVAVLHSRAFGRRALRRLDAARVGKQAHRGRGPLGRIRPGAPARCDRPVDEEHDGSYKQSESPRYHARDVPAVVRAKRAGAVCLLGSATPSLESWANARSGKYTLLELPDRVGGGILPEVRVVDLRVRGAEKTARAEPPVPPRQVISPVLFDALRRRLDRREQTILLLNRRGYASFALCRGCGDVMECPSCSVSMTLHRGRRRMICHHCGRHTAPPPLECARCGSSAISYRGLGTEQVETHPAGEPSRGADRAHGR